MEKPVQTDRTGDGLLSRMALNDNKAGMEGLDRDRINKIILEASKGSKFYENERKKERQVNQRLEKMMMQKANITDQQLRKAQAEVERVYSDLERERELGRVIVHVDMDAFYAAVEMRESPDLRDKPMAVGSMSMLSTSNYHARRFGVRAAMPGFIAKRLCPNLVIVPTNFGKYREVSAQVREVFADYDPHFLPMSLDEAYLDITDHLEQRQHFPESMRTHSIRAAQSGEVKDGRTSEAAEETDGLSPVLFDDSPNVSPTLPPADSGQVVFGTSAEEAVREMRFRIEQKTSLTASAGIAPNIMLAKVCSDKNKPNGQYRIPSDRQAVMDFIHDLPVRKVSGIGKVTEKMLGALDIITCSQLGQKMALLSLLFSETSWHHFLQISMGLGSTHIERDSERKSMSTERTFGEMSDVEEQYSLCRELCNDLAEDLQKEGLKGKTVTLKLKNVNFEVKTRAYTLQCPVFTTEELFAAAKELLKAEIDNVNPQPLRLRLMGVRVSSFTAVEGKRVSQRSIVGFLQSGASDPNCSTPRLAPRHKIPLDPTPKSSLLPPNPPSTKAEGSGETPIPPRRWGIGARDSTAPPQQSFFLRARSQRLAQQLDRGANERDTHSSGSAVDPAPDISGLEPASVVPASAVPVLHPDSSLADSATNASGVEQNLSPNIQTVITSTSVTRETDPSPFVHKGSNANACPSTSSTTDSAQGFTCPVCCREIKTVDLGAFNRHIDECLGGHAVEGGGTEGVTGRGGHIHVCEEEEDEEMSAAQPVVRRPGNTDSVSDVKPTLGAESHGLLSPKEDVQGWVSNLRTVNLVQERNGHSNSNTPHVHQIKAADEVSSQTPVRVSGSGHASITSRQIEASSGPGVASATWPESEGGTLTCPVCNQPQDGRDLALLNQHVDMCLNQRALLDLRPSNAPADHPHAPAHGRARGGRSGSSNRGKNKRQGSPPPPPSKRAKSTDMRNTIDRFFKGSAKQRL